VIKGIRAGATHPVTRTLFRTAAIVTGAYFAGIAFEHGRMHGRQMELNPLNPRAWFGEWQLAVVSPNPLEMHDDHHTRQHNSHQHDTDGIDAAAAAAARTSGS
jgi:hypothetical protein